MGKGRANAKFPSHDGCGRKRSEVVLLSMRHTGLAGQPSKGCPFSGDFRVFIYKRKSWKSSATLPPSVQPTGTRVSRGQQSEGRALTKVPGRRESLAGPGTWTKLCVSGKGWGHPSIPEVGRRGSSSNAQRSKKSVRQEENVPLSYVLVERKTRQMSFSACSLDRLFYNFPG